jgi:hypothetical protein
MGLLKICPHLGFDPIRVPLHSPTVGLRRPRSPPDQLSAAIKTAFA